MLIFVILYRKSNDGAKGNEQSNYGTIGKQESQKQLIADSSSSYPNGPPKNHPMLPIPL